MHRITHVQASDGGQHVASDALLLEWNSVLMSFGDLRLIGSTMSSLLCLALNTCMQCWQPRASTHSLCPCVSLQVSVHQAQTWRCWEPELAAFRVGKGNKHGFKCGPMVLSECRQLPIAQDHAGQTHKEVLRAENQAKLGSLHAVLLLVHPTI